MTLYPTECSVCEEEVAVEWEGEEQLSDLCHCGLTVCIDCVGTHRCSLLPCPYCHSPRYMPIAIDDGHGKADSHWVECQSVDGAWHCDAQGPTHPTRHEAIKSWNEVASLRATVDRLVEENGRLKHFYSEVKRLRSEEV